MDNLLYVKDIDINYEWKKTILAKLGKKHPSRAWIQQLVRIYNRKYKKNVYKYNFLSNDIDKVEYVIY